MPYAHDTVSLLQTTYSGLNHVQGLLIAIIAAILMKQWKQLFPMAAGATLVNLLVNLVEPVLRGGQFHLPENLISLTFWLELFVTLLIFALIIAIFFFVKSLFIKPAKA
jgi:hypothetical protein